MVIRCGAPSITLWKRGKYYSEVSNLNTSNARTTTHASMHTVKRRPGGEYDLVDDSKYDELVESINADNVENATILSPNRLGIFKQAGAYRWT